jgi:DsbC/DsbD-like thiol-disulfide interchange protein
MWSRMLPRRLPINTCVLACLLASAVAAVAADDPVAWSGRTSPGKPLPRGARFTVELDALIQPGWHLYSLDQPDGGPIATEITLPAGQPFSFAGVIAAPKPKTVFDPNFNMRVGFYIEKVQFRVPLEVGGEAAAGRTTLNIQTRYQCCNDKLCLPPKKVTVPISIEVHP